MVLAPSRKSTVQIHSVPGDSGRYHNTGPMAKTAQKTTPEKANHLRCWRSTPCARRKRTTNEIPPATATASVIKRSTIPSVPSSAARPSTPKESAMRTSSRFPSGPGSKAQARRHTTAMRSSQPTSLQRRYNSRLSGKSKKTWANTAKTIGPPSNAASQTLSPRQRTRLGHQRVESILFACAHQRESEAQVAEDPTDRVSWLPRSHQGADGCEGHEQQQIPE